MRSHASERGAGERDALAVDRGVYQHARAVQDRAAGNGVGDPGRVEPPHPGFPVAEAQQREFEQVGRFGDAVAPGDEPGTANREEPLRAEAHDSSPGQPPSPCRTARSTSSRAKSTWCGVAEIRRSISGCFSAKRPSRCTSHLAAKSGEVLTVRTPELCRCTRRAVPSAIRSSASRTTARYSRPGSVITTRWRSRLKSRIPRVGLERLDLVAHRPRRDAELFGRPREALAPRRGLEGSEGVQRRQAAQHCSAFARKAKDKDKRRRA